MLEKLAKYSGVAVTEGVVAAVEKDVTAAEKDVTAAKKEKENVKRMESDCAGVTGNGSYGQK